MPNINTIPIPTFTGIEPYHFLFDNLPISAIASREEMISDATDLNTEILNILKMPDIAEKLNGLGAEIVGSSPQQFDAYVKSEIAKWGKVARDNQVTLD
jgi:hypothetical protein